MTPTTYSFSKSPPVNLNVLQQQINNDAVISVGCVSINYDGVSALDCNMEDVLTGPQQTRLAAVVAAHNGTSKGFLVGLPLPLFDDFATGQVSSALGWMLTTIGTGGANIGTSQDNDHPGILQLTSGILGTGAVCLHLGLQDFILGSGKLNMEFLVNLHSLSAGLNTYQLRIGLGDTASGDMANGVYLEYDAAQNANWRAKSAKASSRTPVDSGIVVATGWRKFSFVAADDASQVQMFVDDAYAATMTSNLPTAGIGPMIQLTKTLGTTPTLVDVDYFYVLKNTSRTDFG